MNEEVFKTQLKNCNTMAEFLAVCGANYDFINCKLGPIAKATLIAHIGKVITISGAKPKK
jgi:hypothetical protein